MNSAVLCLLRPVPAPAAVSYQSLLDLRSDDTCRLVASVHALECGLLPKLSRLLRAGAEPGPMERAAPALPDVFCDFVVRFVVEGMHDRTVAGLCSGVPRPSTALVASPGRHATRTSWMQ